jgi:hypothetical protein
MEPRLEPEHVRLGWTERVYASVPLSPAAVGVALAGALVLAFGVSEFALGRHLLVRELEDPSELLRNVRIAVVHCLLAVYLPTAYLYLLRGYRGTLGQLRGDLDCSDSELADLRARIGRYGPVALGLAGLVGVGIVLWMTRVTTPVQFDPWDWSVQIQEARWARVLGVWIGWWFGIFILALTAGGARIARLATRVSPIDLLDLRTLRPFTRQALLNALLIAGAIGITLLILVDSGFWEVVIGYWISSMVLIVIGLLVSLQPIHRLIRDAKRRELDWCRDALIRERAKLREPGAERSRIDEIVAYRGVVEGVSAWPADSSTFVRISLYLLIPLGSWAGGAVVERFVDSLLG